MHGSRVGWGRKSGDHRNSRDKSDDSGRTHDDSECEMMIKGAVVSSVVEEVENVSYENENE